MLRKTWIWIGVTIVVAVSVAMAALLFGRDHITSKSPLAVPANAVGAGVTASALSAYARADSSDDLNMAREVERELKRLRPILGTLDDDVLAAYASYGPGTLPIGTYLQSQGHPFAVLTEPMLVAAFANEVKRRDLERENRRSLVNGTILALIGIALGYAARFLQSRGAMPGRNSLAVDYDFASSPDIGNRITIRNLTSTPLLVTHWSLLWRRWRWFRWDQAQEITPAESFQDFRLDGHTSKRFTFCEENYFDWGPDAHGARPIYFRLHVAGRSRPIFKRLYG